MPCKVWFGAMADVRRGPGLLAGPGGELLHVGRQGGVWCGSMILPRMPRRGQRLVEAMFQLSAVAAGAMADNVKGRANGLDVLADAAGRLRYLRSTKSFKKSGNAGTWPGGS